MPASYQRRFKANHGTRFADAGRRSYALKKRLIRFVMGVVPFLLCVNGNEPLKAQTSAIEGHNTQGKTPRDNQSTAAATTAHILILARPAKQRSLAELQRGLRSIAAEDRKLSTTKVERERQTAVLRLRMYRFLCYLPQQDLLLESQLNVDALAVADICRRLGKLSHSPDNPGMPEDEYQQARAAAGKCNLAFGTSDLSKAVDMWMNDSDGSNLGQLGHRRWCLNPTMLKLGFGHSGDFCAMWAFDNSRMPAPDYDFISFPPPDFVPIDFFAPEYAWSISLNPAKYRVPELKAITVELLPVRQDQADREHALEIEQLAVNTQGFGVDNCIIFRPKSLEVRPHLSYQLNLSGLQTLEGKPTNLTFIVRFVDAIVAAKSN